MIGIITSATHPNASILRGARWIACFVLEEFQQSTRVFSPFDALSIINDGDRDVDYTKFVQACSHFIIMMNEYNHGYPGRLKTLLDGELEGYYHKKVLPVGWSSGGFGGSRAVENILPIFRALGLQVTKTSLYVSHYQQVFDEESRLIDPSFQQKARNAIAELLT